MGQVISGDSSGLSNSFGVFGIPALQRQDIFGSGRYRVFFSSGSFTVSANVSKLRVRCIGGGGAGGAGGYGAGGGGGGGGGYNGGAGGAGGRGLVIVEW